MRESNINLAKAKELICGGKVGTDGKTGIKFIALIDEFQNEYRGDRSKISKAELKSIMKGALV